jgi:hypothetical protein
MTQQSLPGACYCSHSKQVVSFSSTEHPPDTIIRFTHTSAASGSELRAHWIQVWQWAARNLSAPGTSRAACYLLEAVFNARLLDAIATTETVDATLFSESLSGFCGLSDSSLSLWRTVLMSRVSDNAASADKIAIRTVNWLTANWNMRKLSGDLAGCPS